MRKMKLLSGVALSLALVMAFGTTASAVTFVNEDAKGEDYYWNYEEMTLELNNATIDNGVYFDYRKVTGDIKIVYSGNTTISSTGSNTIGSGSSTILNANLKLEAADSDAQLSVQNTNETGCGITANSVSIKGGTVSVKSERDCIAAYNWNNSDIGIQISDANVDVECSSTSGSGLRTQGDKAPIVIRNSEVTIGGAWQATSCNSLISVNGNENSGENPDKSYKDLFKGKKVEITASGKVTVDGKVVTKDTEDTPEPPETPDTPDTPEPPETPDTPDTPDTPVADERPDTTVPAQNATISGKGVSVEVNNGAVAVSNISKDMINEIANTATNGNAIVLDVSKVEGGSKNDSKVTLTKETMSNIADVLSSTNNNKENLVVKTNAATVTIDATALSAVVSQAKDENIQIVVENKVNANLNDSQQAAVKEIASEAGKEVVQTFEAYIVSGAEKITDLKGGEVTVGKLDFSVPAGKDAGKYKVYAISESGELTPCDTWVENGSIMFKTGTLSNYVLVYDANL